MRRTVLVLGICLAGCAVALILFSVANHNEQEVLRRYVETLIPVDAISVKDARSGGIHEFGGVNKSWRVSVQKDELTSFIAALESFDNAKPSFGDKFWAQRMSEVFGIRPEKCRVYEKAMKYEHSQRLHHVVVAIPVGGVEPMDVFINVESF